MAGQTEQAAGTDISPMGSWFVRHPIATLLVLVYATTTALVFVPKELTEPGLLPGGATPHGVLENVLGSAVPAFIITALVSGKAGVRDIARRSFWWWVSLRWYLISLVAPLFLSDRRHDPVWFRAAARCGPELVAAVHRIPAGIGDHDLAGQCRRGDRMDRARLRLISRSSWSAPRRRADDGR
jgi:hypothetical protein